MPFYQVKQILQLKCLQDYSPYNLLLSVLGCNKGHLLVTLLK